MRISDWSSDVCSSDLFSLNYTYSSKSYQEFDEYLFVPELSLVSAQMSWQINDMYKVSLWGRNLTNKFYYYNMSAVNLASTGSAADQRTYGVHFEEIGRASCRERVGQYVYSSVVAASLKKNKNNKK